MKWTQEHEQIIRDNHGKLTLPQIHRLIDHPCSYTGFRSKCQGMGLFRDKSKVKIPWKNHHNTRYWETPNLINTFYSGWIASDGCITKLKTGHRFSLKLAIKDEHIIDDFMRELDFHGKKLYCISKSPHSDNMSTCCSIQVNCFDENAAYLKQHYNLSPCKTERLGPTNLTNPLLNWAFVAGMLEGDGTIAPNAAGIYTTICSSSPHIIKWFKNFMDDQFPAEKYSVTRRIAEVGYQAIYKIYRYSISGLRAAVVINYLYQFPVKKLARKWDNPKVWEFINQKKAQYPDLFIVPDQNELQKLLPNKSAQIQN
jgi:hypothetical protein